MHAPLDGKLLILLAHPDDEIFILPFLSKVQVKTFFVYLTNNSRYFSADRSAELNESIQSFQTRGHDFQIEKLNKPCRDGFCFLDLSEEHFRQIDNFIKTNNVTRIATLALEGGHQDHDVTSLFSRKLAIFNRIDLIEFASYRKPHKNLFSLAVMKPQKKGVLISFSRLEVIHRVLSLTLLYKSQWRTWLGLLPFILYRYSCFPFYSEAANLQIDGRYISLYESRMHASKIDVLNATRWLTI
jgi:hypothetical protein